MTRLLRRRRSVSAFILCLQLAFASASAVADSITTKTFNKLTEAQEMMAEDNVPGAIAELELLLTEVNEDSLDQALTLQMLGYAEMGAERFEVAIGHLRASLALDKLPESVKYNVGYMVAQLYAALGQFDEALDFCLLYTSPSPRDLSTSRMPSSA